MPSVPAGPPASQPGTIVREARKAQRLSLIQLGERTGYSPSQVSRYERGITPGCTLQKTCGTCMPLASLYRRAKAPPEVFCQHGHPAEEVKNPWL